MNNKTLYFLNRTKDMEIIATTNSNSSYPVHNHVSVYTLCLITDGNIEISINKTNIRLYTGDSILIPPYCPHSIQADSEYSMISICISKQLVENMETFDSKNLFRNQSVNNIRKQLEISPEQNFSIDEMSKSEFISKYHFIRIFKQEVGLTPHKFQLQNRIRKAQRLLRENNKITEVAMETGFFDQSHFIKQFKKIVQMTPSDYISSCKIL